MQSASVGRQKRPWRNTTARLLLRRLWLLLLVGSALLFLLTACADPARVVLRPVALPKVAAELKAKLPAPKCALRAADEYLPGALSDELACLDAAGRAARERHAALAAAVSVREAKMDELMRDINARSR